MKITFENFPLHGIVDWPDLFLGLQQILELNTIEEIEIVFDTLERLSDGLFERFLAFYCLLSKLGKMLKVLFLHLFLTLLAYELIFIKYKIDSKKF